MEVFVQVEEDFTAKDLLGRIQLSENLKLLPTAEKFYNTLIKSLVTELNSKKNEGIPINLMITWLIQQDNSNDCGPFLVNNMVSEALDLPLKQISAIDLRQHHDELLAKDKLSKTAVEEKTMLSQLSF